MKDETQSEGEVDNLYQSAVNERSLEPEIADQVAEGFECDLRCGQSKVLL